MTYRDIAAAQLRIDEGWKSKPYRDTVGKLTIGCGRNLDDVGLTDGEISFLLENDLRTAEATARVLFPSFDSLSEARKAILLNMAFNMGQSVLAGFHGLRAAIAAGDWGRAAQSMINSRWYTQVGDRAKRLVAQMRTG